MSNIIIDSYPFLQGLGIGFSLIIAIGMQNAFVLKQGILQNHVLIIATLCSIIDALLIIIGVNGLGVLLSQNSWLLKLFHWGGILFLFCYGTRAFISSIKVQSLNIDDQLQKTSIKEVISTLLVVTLLNPHTYLDSCILMASISSDFSTQAKISFTLGAIIASIIWFFSLSFGAKFLRPFFSKAIAWKILDFIIGVVMYSIAISLIMQSA